MGYPSQKGGGIYWSSDYYLVVNKETAHMDQIREYLISMYDFERQCNADGYTVRNDLMEELLKVDEYLSPPMLVYGKVNLVHIELKPDGTTWDQEYLELLNRAKPYRNMDPIIEGIIMEEVGAYFSGDRDVESAAAQIQNRVQLYLDERN